MLIISNSFFMVSSRHICAFLPALQIAFIFALTLTRFVHNNENKTNHFHNRCCAYIIWSHSTDSHRRDQTAYREKQGVPQGDNQNRSERIHRVGYDASNITMIIGDNGVILIDAGKFTNNSEEVYREFRNITDKPITGVILTHGHGDHTRGLPVFLKDNKPQIWAAENFGSENDFPTS